MSPPEVAAFEAEMAADPALAELVRRHRLERQGLELLIERDLFAQMQAWDREAAMHQPTTTTAPRRGIIRPMAVLWRVAAVLTVALLGWWLLRESPTQAPEAAPKVVETKPEIRSKAPTVRKHQAPYKPTTTPANPNRTEEETETAIAERTPSVPPTTVETPADLPPATGPDYAALSDEFYRDRDFVPPGGAKGGYDTPSTGQALDSYQKGKFDDVISNLKPLSNIGPDAVQRKELIGLSYYKNGQWDAAIPYFREVISSGKQPYAQRAEWAMALTLLKQMPAKKPLFDRVMAGILANPQHAFYSRAKALQERF